MPQLLVFGARNLGRVIAEHLISQGWEATGVARSEETVAAFPGRGLQADLTDRDQMRRVVEQAGAFDLAVNAYSPKGRFGGGDLTTTDDDAMAPYLEQLLPEVFSFYRLVGASLAERGGGTLTPSSVCTTGFIVPSGLYCRCSTVTARRPAAPFMVPMSRAALWRNRYQLSLNWTMPGWIVKLFLAGPVNRPR